jgi:hypothetical protein
VTVIDHRAQMLDAIEVAANSKSYEQQQARLALAQVHATALLVEEQRIANIISLIGYAEELGHADHDAENELLWRTAREALGLS